MPGHTFRVEEGEDGVPVAVTSMVPKWEGEIFRFEEAVRLKEDEDRPESLLHEAREIRRGPDGHYYVMDRGNYRIAVFGPDGEFVRSFGREGNGPGEFRNPMLHSVGPEDIVVYDHSNRRANRFSLQGRLLGTYSYTKAAGTVMGLSPEGEYLVVQTYRTERLEDRSRFTWYETLVVTSAGDTVGSISTPRKYTPPPQIVEGNLLSRHFESVVNAHHFRGQGILLYDNAQPEFLLCDVECRPIRRYRMEMERQPVTEEDREAVYDHYRDLAEEGLGERERAYGRRGLEDARIEDYKPYFLAAWMDAAGYFWVYEAMDMWTADPRLATRYYLLSHEGEFLGRVQTPPGLGGAPEEYLCRVIDNEETGDMEYVVYRAVPVAPGFTYP